MTHAHVCYDSCTRAIYCISRVHIHHVTNNTLQHTATNCNTLQHTATHCNTMHQSCPHTSRDEQHTATHLQHTVTHLQLFQTCLGSMQHTATHCNTLQHTATCRISRVHIYYVTNRAMYTRLQCDVVACCRCVACRVLCTWHDSSRSGGMTHSQNGMM